MSPRVLATAPTGAPADGGTIVIAPEEVRGVVARKRRAAARRAARARARPDVCMSNAGIVWHAVAPGRAREVVRVERGREVYQSVDTRTYGYSMLCACGRVRYAKRNTIHEVTACRVCAHEQRLQRRRAASGRGRRK